MLNGIKIGNRSVGSEHEPFVIAEMSGNHNQSLERALMIVDAAGKAGADALKLQTYTADTLTIPGVGRIEDKSSLWYGNTLHELYQKAYTPWEWHAALFERARTHGMIPFSTPFDETAVDFLEDLGASVYKIASFENTDWKLLQKVASTKKPVIMSTGATSLADLAESVRVLRDAGCKDLVLLKCTSSYPAEPFESNILTIPHMREMFKCEVGLSDHTAGCGVAVASIALGATVIEKHFTLDRDEGGVDAAFSLEPAEFHNLKVESKRAWQGLGEVMYETGEKESKSLIFKRSIFVVQDVPAGQLFTAENVRVIRPGDGLKPKHLSEVLGRKATKDIKRGTPMTWEMLR